MKAFDIKHIIITIDTEEDKDKYLEKHVNEYTENIFAPFYKYTVKTESLLELMNNLMDIDTPIKQEHILGASVHTEDYDIYDIDVTLKIPYTITK